MASAKAQIHFSGESPCGKFVANAFRPSFCSKCSKLISKHRAEVVDDSVVERALEHLVESLPSTVLCQESGQGALFLGGYKAAINLQFLTEQHVDVVTAAGGLEKLFGPKYEREIESAKKQGVEYFVLDWVDAVDQQISDDDWRRAVTFIDKQRAKGRGVLVHCAQGKSRSATVCVAYLMAKQQMSFSDALAFVQQQRKMADPNPGFIKALKTLESSAVLTDIRREINN